MRILAALLVVGLIGASQMGWSATEETSQSELTFVGSCSWGPRLPGGQDCIHLAGNALASLYLDKATGQTFIYNRITKTNENFCQQPVVAPKSANLIASQGFWWTDAGATKASKTDLDGTLVGQVQSSTGSYNFLQAKTGKTMAAYAPCFLQEELN